MELFKKHRPKLLKHLIGQPNAVKTLKGLLDKKDFPHTLLLTGPSGCGKTSIAYILRGKLNCSEDDFAEYDCTDFRGIDMVRELKSRIHVAPYGKCKIYYLDECHQLTSEAQNGLLKLLEFTPEHVYFMLSTTDPNKLKPTIVTRSTEVAVKLLADDDMESLLKDISKKESSKLSEACRDRIVEAAAGSARKALVILNQIQGIESEKERLAAIEIADSKKQAIEIARTLMKAPAASWPEMAAILKGVNEDPEQLRYLVLSYCTSILLNNVKRLMPRASLIIDVFRDNFYDSKKAGLVASCYEVIHSKVR